MTVAEISQYLGTVLAVIALLAHAKGYFSSSEKENAAAIAMHNTKLTEHDRRIQAVEGDLKHMPNTATAHSLQLAMEKLSGRFDALEERLKPIAANNERLTELLLEQARK